MSSVKEYVWLSECIRYTSIDSVLERFETPEGVLLAKEEELLDILSKNEVSKILNYDFSRAIEIIENCFLKEILIITIKDAAYPDLLRNIANPPLVLYIKGRLPDLNNLLCINVIGTRNASAYGKIIAKKLSHTLADAGAIIVSGLATGIDSIANKQALIAGKPTIAVLGCSVDICYPSYNRELMDDIIATGAVISEFPPTTKPHGSNFPQRNRIMSGLSRGTLVIEAPLKSGTLITANFALEQGRDVFAVPGNIDSTNSKGCNDLIKNGAKIVTSALDVLEEYSDEIRGINNINTVLEPIVRFKENDGDKNTPIETYIKKEPKKPTILIEKFKEKREDMSENESILYDIIKNGCEFPDEIIAKSSMPPAIVMSTLTMLEIYGDIYKIDKRLKIKEK